MLLPVSRGPLSEALVGVLGGKAALDAQGLMATARETAAVDDRVLDDDLQLSLWILYELHYLGFDDVDADWEWHPDLLRVRAELERCFEDTLRSRTEPHVRAALDADGDIPTRLFELTESFEGPSVARYVHREATQEQFLELMVHRSIYHLKESDPQSWVIPRIQGKPKAALVELLYDEYGGGRPERLHATMFGDSLEGCGLEREYGAYLDRVPAYTLAVNNAMSLLGLHRRLRGAALGHLGAFEATSSLPCRRFAAGIRRLGLPDVVAAYFDEHIEADAVHEQLAFRDICAELVAQDEALLADVFFGATVCLYLDSVAGVRMLEAWQGGRSTLLDDEVEAVAS